MGMFIVIALTAFCLWLSYKLWHLLNINRKLKWLHHFPGWPILGHALEFGDNTETINDISRLINKHGKLIKVDFFMQPIIIATDYEFLEFLLGGQLVLNKTSDYRFLEKWLGTGLLTSEGPKWKKMRKLITPAFHFSILEQFIESFEINGQILVEKMKKEIDKESVDIYPLITLYALDVICETAMGVSINAQKNTESDYVKNVKEMCRIMVDRSFSLFKTNDFLYLFSKDYYKELQVVKKLHSVTYSVIDARRKELKNKNLGEKESTRDELGRKRKMAFLDILLKSTIDGQPLTREEIREEVDTFMFEGHDTTTSAMSFALYLLAGHPEVQTRAFEEQKLIFGDDHSREVSHKDLQEMKYLELVIKETLRLYPSVPMYGRSTNEDTYYKGNLIPKGISITVFTYGVLRDPDNYSEPDKFNPSRFEHIDGKRPYTYIPFSAGPRNCIGQKFAMLEIKSTLSQILRNFELHPTTPEHKVILVSEAVLKSKNGVKLKLSKRKW